MDTIVHSVGDTCATDVDSEVHSAGAQDTAATDMDAAVHSDANKVTSAKSSTVDVTVDQPEGSNAVVDAIVYPEGVAFGTDVNTAVHSVGENARAEISSTTDVGAIIHSEGNSTATDVDSAVHSAGAQDIFTTEADAAAHSLQHSQSQLGRPEHYFQNKGDPLQNFILPFYEAN